MKKTNQVSHVHFTVDAEWVTDFVRTRWSEGEYRWCIDFLNACGVPDLAIIYKIINGKARMVNTEKDNEFILGRDNWNPVLDHCHLGLYPDPSKFESMRHAENVLLEYKARSMFSIFLEELKEEKGDAAVARLLGSKIPRAIDYIPDLPPALASFYESETINEEIGTGKPLPGKVYENGIITPDGLFYRCGSRGHNLLAVALGYNKDNKDGDYAGVEDALANGCVAVTCNLVVRKVMKPRSGINAKQRKVISEWYKLTSYSQAPFYQVEFEDQFSEKE